MIWHHPRHCSVWDWKIPDVALLEMLLPWTLCCITWSVRASGGCIVGWGCPRQEEGCQGPCSTEDMAQGLPPPLSQPYPSFCHCVLCPKWKEPALPPCLPGNEFFNRATKMKSLSLSLWNGRGKKRGVESSFIGIRFSRKSALHPKSPILGPNKVILQMYATIAIKQQGGNTLEAVSTTNLAWTS